jgi:DNA-binding GntR family transcriptional regulator
MSNATLEQTGETRAEQIRQMLAAEIVRGRLPPGLPLDETEIARKFGVSRTPVREAIRQLEATGLAEARPRRGAVVAAVTKERLDEMFFLMLELEALCAREAARNMTDRERTALQKLLAAGASLAARGKIEAYAKHNLEFHDALYAGGHNSYLKETTLAVRKRLAPFRRAQFFADQRPEHSHEEHARVATAIVRGDGDAAARAMRAHITAVRDAYVALFPHDDPV